MRRRKAVVAVILGLVVATIAVDMIALRYVEGGHDLCEARRADYWVRYSEIREHIPRPSCDLRDSVYAPVSAQVWHTRYTAERAVARVKSSVKSGWAEDVIEIK